MQNVFEERDQDSKHVSRGPSTGAAAMTTHVSDARQNEWSEWLEVWFGKTKFLLFAPIFVGN